MKTLYKIKEMLWNELDDYANKSKLAPGDIEPIHVIAETIKDICKIDRMTFEMDGASHNGGMWNAHGSYGSRNGMNGRSRNEGMSDTGSSYDYETSGRRRHYVAGHYSYGDDPRKMMYKRLGELSEMATTEKERAVFSKAMRELENA